MGAYTTAFEMKAIAAALGDNASLRVLDIGGGDGRYSALATELGHAPTLLEYESAPLEIFREREADAPAIRASGLELPVRDAVFDAALTIEVPECVTGYEGNNLRFFAEVNRVLKPGGTFIFTAHNKDSYIARLKSLARNRPDYEVRYYSDNVEDYKRKLNDASFDVVQCLGYRWVPFTRDSNAALIPMLGWIENALGMRRLSGYSPWLFFVARKR